MKAKKPVILGWDIEATSLTANWGTILCVGVKEFGRGGKTKIYSIDDYPEYKKDPTNDLRLVRDVRDRLSNADMWVTWYGAGYDVPMLNSRLVYHRLDPLPPVAHVDGWKVARYKMKLTSNRLASVQGFLDLPTEKSPVEGTTWVKAIAGNRDALKYIKTHCVKDVDVLEEAYDRIKPLITNHPNLNLVTGHLDGCPVCGERALEKRGFGFAGVSVYSRYHCKACGAWSKSKGKQQPVGPR